MDIAKWIATLSVAFYGIAPLAAQPRIVIKFSHVVAPDAPKGKAAEFFARRVAELTGGEVRVDAFANSTLFKDRLVQRGMSLSERCEFNGE